MSAPFAGLAQGHPIWDSRRPWSLWEMINFHLRSFVDALAYLNIAQTRAQVADLRDPDGFVDDELRERLRENLGPIAAQIEALSLPKARGRLATITVMLERVCTNRDIHHQVDELFNAVEQDASDQFFCHYKAERLSKLKNMAEEWAVAFQAFPSAAQPEIIKGVDCYALGHDTACVFHMARVGEIGLRIIGRERGVRTLKRKVPIEWGTWGQVFQAIEPTIDGIRKTRPNGPNKTNALAFYDRIFSDLRAIQSLYRDQTMHLRDEYDEGEAQSAMFRVRELMTTLASKLDENSSRAIPWSAWK